MKPEIREILTEEYEALGKLMVAVYSELEGFPSPAEQPEYYDMLADIGRLNEKTDTSVLVALSHTGEIMGGIVYFSDMAQYGSGGTATKVKNSSGIRLLGVDRNHRGKGVGKTLTYTCIERARAYGHKEVILHTTESMKTAWRLYVNMGFKRSPDLDFMQEKLQVYGFRLALA